MTTQVEPRRVGGGVPVPPHNLEAEESVLGSVMLSAEAANIAFEQLRPEDFYKPAHQVIFEAVAELFNGSQPIDAITVADALRRNGQLERVGGVPLLTTLLDAVPTTANIAYYADIVSETAARRRLLRASSLVSQYAMQTERDHRRGARLLRGGDLPGGRAAGGRRPGAGGADAAGDPGAHRGAGGPGRRGDRPVHRVPRPRPAAGGPAAGQPGGRRRPSQHGQDRPGPQHLRERGRAGRDGGGVHPRDEPGGGRPAAAVLHGRGGLPPAAHRAAHPRPVEPGRAGDLPPLPDAHLRGRLVRSHGHLDPGQVPPAGPQAGHWPWWWSTTCS